MKSKGQIGLQILFTSLAYLLAFPPFYLGFLMPFAFASFIDLAVSAKNTSSAFKRIFLFGLITQTALLYWMTGLMKSGLFIVLIFSIILLVVYQTLYFSLMSLFIRKMSGLSIALALILFPFINVGQEKLHELGQISFPWLSSGYCYGSYYSIIQAASSFGVYLFSFVISVSAALIYLGIKSKDSRKVRLTAFSIVILFHLILMIYGNARIKKLEKITDSSNDIKISLIQGNVNQHVRWDFRFVNSVIDKQTELTELALQEDPDLVVWSESALPFYFYRRVHYKDKAEKFFNKANIPFLFGSLHLRKSQIPGRKFEYFNSAFLFRPGLEDYEKSSKIKLVPFAEKLPFENIFPIISKVDLGEADFSPGDELKLFSIKGKNFFVPICYEVVYPEHIRDFVQKGADFMIAITNDGWFGRSGMPFQHTNISRFRCVENGISAARCANSGVSVFYDSFGRPSNATDIYTERAITGRVSTERIDTFFTRHGDYVGWIAMWVMLASILIYVAQKISLNKK